MSKLPLVFGGLWRNPSHLLQIKAMVNWTRRLGKTPFTV